MRLWYLPFFIITFLWLRWKACRIYKKVKFRNIEISASDRYYVVNKIINRFLFLCKVKLIVEGLDNYSNKKHYLLIANHQSNFDPLIILNIFKDEIVAVIAKYELLKNYKVNAFLKIIYSFVIKRDNLRQTLDVFDKAREFMIINKKSLLIFPEGTRSKKLEMNMFKSGAFKIAYQTQCAILPIVIKDSYKINFNIFQKTQKVHIEILKPLSYHNFVNINSTKLSENIQEKFQNILNK